MILMKIFENLYILMKKFRTYVYVSACFLLKADAFLSDLGNLALFVRERWKTKFFPCLAAVSWIHFLATICLDNENCNALLCCRFIYSFLVIGVTLCVVTCSGHIAAETANGCCLCFVSFK